MSPIVWTMLRLKIEGARKSAPGVDWRQAEVIMRLHVKTDSALLAHDPKIEAAIHVHAHGFQREHRKMRVYRADFAADGFKQARFRLRTLRTRIQVDVHV